MPAQTTARSFRRLVPHACIGAAIAAAGATAVALQAGATGTDGQPAAGPADAIGTERAEVRRVVVYPDDRINAVDEVAGAEAVVTVSTDLPVATPPRPPGGDAGTVPDPVSVPEFTYLTQAATDGEAASGPEPEAAPAPEPESAPEPAASEGGEVIATTHVPLETWEAVARCESGYGGEPDWTINTGNGYYGGLQFALSSWEWVGGTGYPHEASKATQIEMAERLWERQGWNAWPACSRKLGLR